MVQPPELLQDFGMIRLMLQDPHVRVSCKFVLRRSAVSHNEGSDLHRAPARIHVPIETRCPMMSEAVVDC